MQAGMKHVFSKGPFRLFVHREADAGACAAKILQAGEMIRSMIKKNTAPLYVIMPLLAEGRNSTKS